MTEEEPSWQEFPAGMTVHGAHKLFMTAPGVEVVWLWVRYPMMCLAVDLDLDNAELVAHGLLNAAAEVRRKQTAKMPDPEGTQP